MSSLGGVNTPMKPVDTPFVMQKHSGAIRRVLWHKEGVRMVQDPNNEGNTHTVTDFEFGLKWVPYDPSKPAVADAGEPVAPKPVRAPRKRKSATK